jgi:hypothetical protein
MILPFAIIGDGEATPDDGAFTARYYAVHTGSSVGPRRNSRIPFSAGAVCRKATPLPAELVTETGSTQFRK